MIDPAIPPQKSDPKPSDLGVRTLSAIVMVAVAAAALWLGGWWWAAFVAVVGLGVLWEWAQLAWKIASSWWGRALWLFGGVVYVGMACGALILLEDEDFALPVIGVVVATDIGAYLAGRSIGGPKIAPSISPSKTWAGLGGGISAAVLFLGLLIHFLFGSVHPLLIPFAGVLAIIAQSGDFFESWMKRRAGVKDSGHLIPGHGGLFDRVDGLLPVALLSGTLLSIVGVAIKI